MVCRICGQPAEDELLLGTASVLYARLALCNAHLAAMRINDWWLTIKLMDNVATVSGKRHDDSFDHKPDF